MQAVFGHQSSKTAPGGRASQCFTHTGLLNIIVSSADEILSNTLEAKRGGVCYTCECLH